MRKARCIVLALALSMSISSIANARTYGILTSAGHSINNQMTNEDYKVSEKTQKKTLDLLRYTYLSKAEADESDKYVFETTDRNLASIDDYGSYKSANNKSSQSKIATAKSWLIQHNVLERKVAITESGSIWSAVFYEDICKEYDEFFNTEFVEYYGETKRFKSNFSKFIDKLYSSDLISDMQKSGMLTSSKLSKMKKSITNASGSVVDEESYQKAMDKVKRVVDKYYDALGVADESFATKSDFLMLLYKAVFGPIESRPIVFNKMAVRNSNKYSENTPQYWNGGTLISNLNNFILINKHPVIKKYWDTVDRADDADFYLGDYYYFISSNVYELYFKALLDKGVIFKNEFTKENDDSDNLFGKSISPGKAFLNSIDDFSSNNKPVWWNDNGLCNSNLSGGLGQCIKYDKDGKIVYRDPNYFSSERLTYQNVLEYIEDVLRLSEDDISEKEADIITYKYGLTYLAGYPSGIKKTISFLVAKGVLSFEDDLSDLDLDSEITLADLYVILYKVANKSARTDFSKITLTDGESFWQSKGYAQSNLSVLNSDTGFVETKGTVTEDEDENTKAIETSSNVALAETKEFTVVKELAKGIKWTYNGVSISSLAKNNSNSEVMKVESTNKKYNGKTAPVWKVTFSVKASSAQKALKRVDSRLSCPIADADKNVSSVTKVSEAGKENASYTMVSKSSFSKISSDISAIEDKVLLNTRTGCQAIILPDLGYALVGNGVVKTNTFLMEKTGDDIYYNLKIILALLDDSFVKKLGVKDTILRTDASFDDKYVKLSNSMAGDANVYKAMCSKMKLTIGMALAWGESGIGVGHQVNLVRVDSITSGLNTLHREFTVVYKKKKYKVTLVVDWKFAIPEVEEFAVGNEAYNTIISNKSSQSAVTKALYTRPSGNSLLESWWDSNYIVSNMLCNFIYGTTGVNYVNSGYLCPSISFLFNTSEKSTSKNSDAILHTLFSGTQHPIKAQIWDQTGSDLDRVNSYFNNDSDYAKFYRTFFDPNKSITATSGLKDSTINSFQALVRRYRSCNKYYRYKTTKYDGDFYPGAFFRTQSGVLYRNLDLDDRIIYTANSKGVKSLEVTTRTTKNTKPTANVSVVGYNGKKMLYVGSKVVKNNEYAKLVPVDQCVVSDSSNPLYNCGKILIPEVGANGKVSTKNVESSSWIYPRFIPYKPGQTNYNDPKDAMSRWRNVYSTWLQEYLVLSSAPSFVNYSNAFYYSSAMEKAAVKFGIDDGWSFFSYGTDVNSAKKIRSNRFRKDTNYVRWLKDEQQVVHGDNQKIYGKVWFKNIFSKIKRVFPNTLGKVSDFSALYGDGIDKQISLSELGINKDTNDIENDSSNFNGFNVKAKADKSQYLAAVPVFYLNSAEWTIYSEDYGKTFSLIHDNGASALCFANYYYSGVAKSIQETIIAKYVNTVDLGEVSAGASVMIGDMQFKVDKTKLKEGVSLSSVAISTRKNKELRRTAAAWRDKKPDTKTAFRTEVADVMKSIMVYTDGKAYKLTNYLKGGKKGINLGSIRKTKNTIAKGIIYRDGSSKDAFGFKKNKSKRVSKSNCNLYEYVRIRLSLDSKLKVRPLDSENTMYAFTYTTVNNNYGSDPNFIFTNEALNYDKIGSPDASLFDAWFSPAEAYTNAKTKFMSLYRQAFVGDVISLIKMLVIIACIWIAIFSWLAYLVLHYGAGRVFLEALANGPGRIAKGGFDLIRILSFGMYTLDDDPKLSRIVVTGFLATTIVVFILYFL